MYAIFLKAKKERKFFPLRPCQRSTESHWWVIAKTNKTVPHRGDCEDNLRTGRPGGRQSQRHSVFAPQQSP